MGGKPQVLVIDDEISMREAVHDILELAEIEVVAAEDGQTGLDLFSRFRETIRVVIIDYSMPGLSSEETMTALRALDEGVSLILSSGYRLRDLPDGLQPDMILSKPYHFTTLIDAVSGFLGSSDRL